MSTDNFVFGANAHGFCDPTPLHWSGFSVNALSWLWTALRTEGPSVGPPCVRASSPQFSPLLHLGTLYVAEGERFRILAVTQDAGKSFLILDLG